MSTKEYVSAESVFKKLGIKDLSFGDWLRVFRKTEEMTQVALARHLGISRQQLNDLEKERKLVSLERANKFAKKLGYPPEMIIGYAIQSQLKAANLKMAVKVEKTS